MHLYFVHFYDRLSKEQRLIWTNCIIHFDSIFSYRILMLWKNNEKIHVAHIDKTTINLLNL